MTRARPRSGRCYFGTLASAAQLLGAGRALLEASASGTPRMRAQFGRPVGAFQASSTSSPTWRSGWSSPRPLLTRPRSRPLASGSGPRTAPRRDVSAAKVACAGAAYRAARAALQVHGAIGYTAEHELSRWLVQVRALVPAWGSPAEHRARVLRELG